MDISPELAGINFDRYRIWTREHHELTLKPAILAFNGEVYRGLDASALTDAELKYADEHLIILSGLYGILKPLDLIQPYRLEMGAKWNIGSSKKNLYKFWGNRISMELNRRLVSHKNKIIVNLSSSEYFNSIDQESLEADVIHCLFLDYKNGEYKSVMTWTKLARGAMAKEIIRRKADSVEELKKITFNGYKFSKSDSRDDVLIFKRKMP